MQRVLKSVQHGLLTLMIIILVFLSLPIQADAEEVFPRVLFEMTDPKGDDWGPGDYTYPQYKQFEPYKGLFDITYFTILEDENYYTLEFVFSEIRDPWKSKYGFSHPLIELYFDNQSGGSRELFRPGAQVRFDEDMKWDIMLHITGWWVKVFRPEDREEAEKSSWNDPEYPFDLENVIVNLEDEHVLKVLIDKAVLGELNNARFNLMIGGFDSFGFNYYREVKEVSDNWAFGGSMSEYSPRVLDLLVPDGMTQEAVLKTTADAKNFPVIPPLRINIEDEAPLIIDRLFIWLGILIVSLILMITVKTKSKKDSFYS